MNIPPMTIPPDSMNSASGNDWDDLRAQWQAQPTPAPDIAALQREGERRNRRVHLRAAIELLVAVIAIGNCVRALLDPRKHIPHGLLWALIAVMLVVATWTFIQRRRQWSSSGLAPHALIAFEMMRARISIRLWRVSIWGSLAVWAGLTALTWPALQAGPDAPGALPPSAWALNLWLNAAVVLVSALIGFCLGLRRRRQLARLQQLQRQLAES